MEKVFFTTKVAISDSFCNREEERRILKAHIGKGQHVVLVAPRRYGKTSLVCRSLKELGNPFAKIDLFCVVYEEDVCNKVAQGISKVVREITSFSTKTIAMVERCFKGANIGLKSGHLELNVSFERSNDSPISKLENLLEGLEQLAKRQKKKVVLFFDEFQDVLKVDETNKLQAAIRSVAQHSEYVTYIFSGSSRVMLKKIFENKQQPLYMLCRKMELHRISSEHFSTHIQTAYQRRYKSGLDENVISTILELTEVHPYYVNLLCDKIWQLNKKPIREDVEHCWDSCLFDLRGKIIADLEPLTTNRMKVITMVALLGEVGEPNGKFFLQKLQLPLSSVQKAVKYLIDHDYLYQHEGALRLIDPLAKKFLKRTRRIVENVC